MTVYLRACPRCEGDLRTNKDMYGEYKECFQCGYMKDEKENGNIKTLKSRSISELQEAISKILYLTQHLVLKRELQYNQ